MLKGSGGFVKSPFGPGLVQPDLSNSKDTMCRSRDKYRRPTGLDIIYTGEKFPHILKKGLRLPTIFFSPAA